MPINDTNPRRSSFASVALAVGSSVAVLPAQGPLPQFSVEATCARVIDPKLPGAIVPIEIVIHGTTLPVDVTVRLDRQGALFATLWSQRTTSDRDRRFGWDGRLPAPANHPYVDPGSYEVVVTATDTASGKSVSVTQPLDVVRLGITQIAALPWSPLSEWQMVYFKRGTTAGAQFYATPAMGEYRNIADSGEVADLDRNDGSPRTSVPIHTATDSPPMEGAAYEDDRFNFPLCYRGGVQPQFAVRFGTTAVGANGLPIPANYPIPGVQLRCVATSDRGPWVSYAGDIAPGTVGSFLGPWLPMAARATDTAVYWSFASSVDGGATWQPVPGRIRTDHRIYTVLGIPRFGATSGVQHSGPWVEVMADLESWRAALGIDTSTEEGVAAVLTKGFGGQIPGVPLPIENVRYDTYVLGGDGGASHYHVSSPNTIQLSRLLDAAGNGLFVNCSDVASSLAAMMGMAGVQNVQMERLGAMTLRAIRGIGAPSYTLNLWGSGSHGFSYHHVVTRTAGVSICDACLWVDEDGAPSALPGTPGFNVDRPWTGTATSYPSLLATGSFTFVVETLPALQ